MFLKSMIAAFGLLMAMTVQAAAATVVFNYTASNGGGGMVSGTFGWDTAVADSNPDSMVGQYLAAGFITGTITGGAQDGGVFNLTGQTIGITNNDFGFATTSRLTFRGGTLVLFNGTPAALTDDSLPTSFDLSGFTLARSLQIFNEEAGLPGSGNGIYSFDTVAAVPVPAGAPMLAVGLGLAALALRCRPTRDTIS